MFNPVLIVTPDMKKMKLYGDDKRFWDVSFNGFSDASRYQHIPKDWILRLKDWLVELSIGSWGFLQVYGTK